MIGYTPQELNAQEGIDKHLEISDHFANAARVLSARIKTEQNKSDLTADNDEDIASMMLTMKRLSWQAFEYAKQHSIEEGLYEEGNIL